MRCSVQNFVVTANMGCGLDFEAVAEAIGAKRPPKNFPALEHKHRSGCTLLVFRSGRVVCTGAKAEQKAREVLADLLSVLRERKLVPADLKLAVRVQNVVVACDLGCQVDIKKAASVLGGVYEPQVFPALQYKHMNYTFLTFSSGKVVCAGAKSEVEAVSAAMWLKAQLEEKGCAPTEKIITNLPLRRNKAEV